MQIFSLEGHPYIALNDLLKVEGLSESGGQAKLAIAAGQVMVNGQVELRKTCKLYVGHVVEFQGETVTISE